MWLSLGSVIESKEDKSEASVHYSQVQAWNQQNEMPEGHRKRASSWWEDEDPLDSPEGLKDWLDFMNITCKSSGFKKRNAQMVISSSSQTLVE